MTLTHINLHAVATKGCGFTSEQLDILGVARPPKRGWVQRLIGTELPDADYARLLALKGSKSKSAKNEPETFAGYQLPPAQEKPRESPAKERELGYVVMRDGSTAPLTAKSGISVAMKIPIELVETVQGLIRLRDSLAKR